jgi:hypothetical protein
MKKIIYSLVIMIAAGSLFTSCLEYVEPAGIQQLRAAKADYLDALATLRLADAELQKANATYVLAMAAYQDALTEGQKIENRIREYDVQIKAAQTEYEVDSLQKAKELLQVTHNTNMANAKATLAQAEESLRVVLRNIAAVQHLLTDAEQTLLNKVTKTYEDAFNFYNAQVLALTKAKAKLWDLEYGFKDSIDWKADYQGQIDLYTAEIARAQAALKAVPERLDLEKWNAELENMKDSIKAYNYDRQATTSDSAYYMVNTYHEGVEEYERAFEAWLDQYNGKVTVSGTSLDVSGLIAKPKNTKGQVMTAAPQKPSKPVFTSEDARITWKYIAEDSDLAATLVHHKFFDLVADYYQDAPFGTDSTVAKGGFFMKPVYKPAGTADTLHIKATVDMKGFIINDSTSTPREYKWKKGNTTITSVGLYGLRGAVENLERELVLVDALSDVPTKQAAYDSLKQIWEADRAYLLGKTYLTEEAEALANLKNNVLVLGEPNGRAEDLIFAIKDFRTSRTGDGEFSGYADSIQLINAIKDFYNAKKAYIGNPGKGFDTLKYKYFGEDREVYLGDLEYSGFVQKSRGVNLFASVYGCDVPYNTVDDHLNKAIAPGFDSGNDYKYDAILGVLRVIFPDNLTDLDTWANAESWIDSGMSTADLTWMIEDGTVSAEDPTYDKTLPKLGLKGIASVKFLEVYNRFWGLDGTAGEIADPALAIWDADCYNENTFKQPYNLVRFTGTTINQNEDLKVILSLVDPNKATLPNTADWTSVDDQSAIFGKPGARSEFYDMLLAEQELMMEKAKTTYSATLAKIVAYVNEVEADFDAKKTEMEDKYNTDLANYNTDNAAWSQYQSDLKAKKEELLTALTGKKDGKVVQTIPTPVNYQVPSCMKKYLDHEGLAVYNGEYDLGGKQLEWANASLKDYPANLKKWMIEARTANHVIGHLNTLLNVLDPAYRAAVKIYTYDWEKYVLAVGADGKYDVNITAMKQDLGDSATDLIGFFENYNKYQKEYSDAWKQYQENCEVELGFWKKVLAKYNAGFDPLEIAIEEQQNIVAGLEKKVELAKKFLDEAEAQYNATVAKLLNK